MGKLNSKTIIITGGSLGIGYAIAKKCVKEGAEVIIVARDENNLSSALGGLSEISKKQQWSYSLDVGNLDAVREFAGWCESNKLHISGLVNCAGVFGPIGKTSNIIMEDFTTAMQINFLGAVYITSAITPLMKSKSRKKIVNISGGGDTSSFPKYTAYSTSKIALVKFTENLAIELLENEIDVNCIAPGFVNTRLHQDTFDAGEEKAGKEFYSKTIEQLASERVKPEMAADLCSFLLSSESDDITGKLISAPWDPWREESFRESLRNDRDLATLRRIDNKHYVKKS